MLPGVTLPASLAVLLGALRPCFTAPSFRTFCGLTAGLAGQVRRRTVCGMLLGAGLARAWPHDRAHYFFARARWQADELGIAVARLVVLLLVPPGQPLTVAVDDTLFRRRGKKVYGAGWQYDGSSPSQDRISYGTCFVTCGIVVSLPFCTRPVCLPVLARLVVPGTAKATAPARRRKGKKAAPVPGTKVSAAVDLVALLSAAFPGRALHAVADAGYRGPALRDLPPAVTWSCRLPAHSGLYDLSRPPPPTPCLWSACLDTRPVRVILARDSTSRRPGLLALVTTDLTAPATDLVTRYAARWSIEQAFADARTILGAGETRPRTRRAVERTVPFALLTHTLVITWY